MNGTLGILNVGAGDTKLSRKRALRRYRVSEKNAAAQKRYHATEKGRAARKAKEQRYVVANRRKRNAKGAVNHAVRRGELPRVRDLPCFGCVSINAAGYHHQSYDRVNWLRVVPLCNRCHSDVHQGLLPDRFPTLSVGRTVRAYEIFS